MNGAYRWMNNSIKEYPVRGGLLSGLISYGMSTDSWILVVVDYEEQESYDLTQSAQFIGGKIALITTSFSKQWL